MPDSKHARTWGARHAGRAALREALPRAWRHWPDGRWQDATHVAADDRGFSEWTFRGTGREGQAIEVRGVDLLVLRDGLIARKGTSRKHKAG